MVKFPKLFKKPWDKESCNFVVQEYDASVGRGWHDVSEATGEIPTKEAAKEYFKPGCHYRVLARYVSGDRAGQLAGVVWKTYEALPGGLKPKEKGKVKKSVEAPKKMKMSELIDGYIDEFDKVVSPMAKLAQVFEKMRESMGMNQPPPQPQQVPLGQSVPPLEFDGKAPWFMHPYIAHNIAEEAKGVIEYAANRFEGILGPVEPQVLEEVEEEEIELPTLAPVEVEEEEEVVEEELAPPEEPIEEIEKLPEAPPKEAVPMEKEAEEALMTVPPLIEEEMEPEAPEEEEKEEVVPSEIEPESKPCLQCGRTDVPLLPNGLCEECAEKLAEQEEGKKHE